MPEPLQIIPGKGAEFSNPVTVKYARRDVTYHCLSETELDTIASLSNSVDLAFFVGSGGICVTLIVTLLTVQLPNPFAFAGFIATAGVSAISTLLFGARARISHTEAKKKLQDIRENSRVTSPELSSSIPTPALPRASS